MLPWEFPGEFFIAIFFKKMGKILIKKSQIKKYFVNFLDSKHCKARSLTQDEKNFKKMFLFHEKNVYENTYKGKSITE